MIAPPLADWAIAGGLVGGAATAIAIVRERIRMSRVPALRSWFAAAAVVVVLAPVAMCCIGVGKAIHDSEYDLVPAGPQWASHATVGEILPLPPNVVLVRVVCENPGAHGPCNDAAFMAATDGVSGERLVARLVEHYRRRGWPLDIPAQTPSLGYWGCRPVRGILPWADHCMQITAEPGGGPWQIQTSPTAGEVVVYVNARLAPDRRSRARSPGAGRAPLAARPTATRRSPETHIGTRHRNDHLGHLCRSCNSPI